MLRCDLQLQGHQLLAPLQQPALMPKQWLHVLQALLLPQVSCCAHVSVSYSAVLWCTMLCCTVLRSAMLCCSGLRITMPCCAVVSCHVPYAVLCRVNLLGHFSNCVVLTVALLPMFAMALQCTTLTCVCEIQCCHSSAMPEVFA